MKKLLFLLLFTGCSGSQYLTVPDIIPIVEAHNKVVKCIKESKKLEEVKECLTKNQGS